MLAAQQAMTRVGGSKAAEPAPLPDFGTGQYTVTAWIKSDGGGTIFSRCPAGGKWIEHGKALFVDGSRLTFDIGWVGAVETGRRIRGGKWIHVALVSKGERRRIYVDGKLSADDELEAVADHKGWMFKVGHTAGDFGGRFKGLIDELRVYSRAMSAGQVKAARDKPDAAGLVLHWPFEGDCSDASGSRNSATKTSNCSFVAGKTGKALRLTGNGYAMFQPGTADPSGPLWARLKKDFRDNAAQREMAWEREDGIWSGGGAVSLAKIAGRYAKATTAPTALAQRAAKLAARARTASDVKAVREMYLASRRRGELLARLKEFKLAELRSTITTMYAGDEMRRKALLARLDAAEAKALTWTDGPADVKTLEDWKASVAQLRNDALLAGNPLFGSDKLLFVKRQTFHSSHFYTDFIDGCSRYGGNISVLHLKTGKVTDLVPEMKDGIFGRFDLHFSATKIAFDWKKAPKEGFRLFEIDIDPASGTRVPGRPVRQLTFPPSDEAARIKKYDNSFRGGTARMYYHQTDDMHPCYLPDGGIIFVSTRCEYGTLCDAPDVLTTTVVHRIDGDGSNMQKLTNSAVSEFSPSMMADGRVLYTRWEYVDKGQLGVKCLWAMYPDGSGTVEVYGNDIQFPPTFLHGRQIPGYSNLFVMLGTPHYPQSGIGTVIRVDTTKNIRTREPMTYMTPHVDVRQEPGWNHLVKGKWVRHTRGPLYMDPFPLSKSVFLVAYNPDKSWKDPVAYGLYMLTESGLHAKIHTEPETSCWQPMPLRPRKAPPVLRSVRDPKLAAKGLAVCTVQDIYHGLEGIKRGEVKFIRVMEQVPRPWDCRRFWDPRGKLTRHTRLASGGTALATKAMWGVVPVEPDGSAHFTVPADRNIYFQALDANYMEVQRERTYVNYRPGEKRSCVGCHETPNDSPPHRASLPLAMKRPPSAPGPQPGDTTGRQVMHYPTYVQPVLDRHCVKCHSGAKPKGKLDLTGTRTTFFNRSYENLIRKVKTYREFSDWEGTPHSPPKTIGSHASPLISIIRTGKQHKDLKLPLADFAKIATWVDASGVYYGSYWGRRHIQFKDHPNFRPVPTFADAISTTCPTPMDQR